MGKEKVVYSINEEDVQEVARCEHDRELSDKELQSVEAKLGDYIDWYQAVDMAIAETVRGAHSPN